MRILLVSFETDIRVFPAFALVALLAGCATKKAVEPVDPRRGDVAVHTIDSPPADTYAEPEKGEAYDSPRPFDQNAAPRYPAELLAQRLPPVSVKVRLIVDESGKVTDVLALDSDATMNPAFFASTEAAVRSWQFSPLVRFGKGGGSTTIEFSGLKETYEGQAQALPFHQDYEFTFRQRDGKGFVSTSTPD
jgi:TonB family protein